MRRLPIFLLVLGFAVSLSARPKTHDAAISILGQPSFTSADSNVPPTSRSFNEIEGVAIDPTTGKLFVADSSNNRILRFSSVAAYQNNAAAEAVFGQPSFEANAANRGEANPSASSLHYPATIAIDKAGRLWVCDYENARVLRFDNASSKPSFTAGAEGVIGLGGFTAATQASNSDDLTGFSRPAGIAVAADGTLWVSDAGLSRILRFDNAASLPTEYQGAASGFLGTINGGVFVPGTTDSAFATELWGLAMSSQGHLWVADPSNHRVLCFFDPVNKSSADLVLGQDDPDSAVFVEPPTASSLNNPYYVTVAPDGTAWVSDYTNYRVLGFLNAANRENGDPANIVLGQPDFVTREAGDYTARKTVYPTQIAIGREGSLFIGEFSPAAHVKRWSDPVTITARKTARASKKGLVVLRGRASGATLVQYRVPGQGGFKRARGTATIWNARITKLKRKRTVVTVRAIAFDNRIAPAKVRVTKPMPKRKKPRR